MAAGIPFMEETGQKAVQNGGRSNSKDDHGFMDSFNHFRKKKFTFTAFNFKSKLFL